MRLGRPARKNRGATLDELMEFVNTFSEQVELKTQLGFVEGPSICSTGFNWVRKNATKLKFIGFVFVGDFVFTDFTLVNHHEETPFGRIC